MSRGYQRQTVRYNNLPRVSERVNSPIRRASRPSLRQKKHVSFKTKLSRFVARVLLLLIASVLVYFILPYGFHRVSMPILFGHNYDDVKLDYYKLLKPTSNYLSNDLFLNQRMLAGANTQKPQMSKIYKTEKMTVLETGLNQLIKKYPTVEPAIFVWDFDTSKYVDIKSTKVYSAASIVKIPVLIQLFKTIETNKFSIYNEMTLTEYYKSPHAGNLQYMSAGKRLTIDNIARTMIVDSDNTSTNMLIAKLGSMVAINQAIRDWGLNSTYVQTWLPDLKGTNYTTAQDLATMLYNLDNPSFLNINSREYVIDYMSHVKNDRLLPQGLGEGASIIHKTGDIGNTLGDAGIVYMPNGKKYIVVVLVNRKYNAVEGKEFIQHASKLIYDYMSTVTY